MILAAGIIAASMIGFFMWQRASLEDIERQQTADFIADHIDHVSSLNSQYESRITFDPDKSYKYTFVEPVINNDLFVLNITFDMVSLSQEGQGSFYSSLTRNIHLLDPATIAQYDILEESQLEEIDMGNRSIEFQSGNDFIIESTPLVLSIDNGKFETVFHTFVYLA